MPAVDVVDLEKRYAGVVAVAGVSFTAAAGQVTAVLGPNGAGKTTTVEACSGLRSPDAGSVRVLGQDPRRGGRELRARIGVMPQPGGSGASGVYPTARAGEVLALFASLHSRPLPAAALLDRLGLARAARTPWRRLSGGQQQRLSLALAVVGRPDVVFLDEPTAGLDVQARFATWDLVRDLRAGGVAIILTTHAMDEAEQLADTVVIMDAGRVVARGTPTELTRATDSPTTLRFQGPAGLPVAELLAALPPGTRAREPEPGRYLVEGAIDPGFLATVTAWCANRGVMPERLSTGSRTLEDVFLELTGRDPRP